MAGLICSRMPVHIWRGMVRLLQAAHEQHRHHFVERGGEGEKSAGNHAGGDERQHDAPEGAQRPGAEAGRGAVQNGVEAGQGGRHRDDDERRAQGGVRQDEPRWVWVRPRFE